MNPNEITDEFNNTQLFSSNYDIESLIKNGANVNHKNIKQETPIFYHVDINNLKLLIDNGADVNCFNIYRQTPLFYQPFKENIQLLLNHGADINHRDHSGESILHYYKHYDIIKYILKSCHPDINIENKIGQTPLFVHNNIKILKQLIKYKANLNHKDHNGNTPLFLHDEHLSIVKLFIKNGANFNELNNDNENILFYNYNDNVIKYLIDLGINTNIVNNKKQNILHIFCNAHPINIKLLKYIIKNTNIDVNQKDIYNKYPLDYYLQEFDTDKSYDEELIYLLSTVDSNTKSANKI